MSLRRDFEGVECPRFGADAVTGTRLHDAPVTAPVTDVTTRTVTRLEVALEKSATATVEHLTKIAALEKANAALKQMVSSMTAEIAALRAAPTVCAAPIVDPKERNRAKVAAWRKAKKDRA